MQTQLTIIKNTGESTTLTLKVLDKTYLNQMLTLQDEILSDLPNTSWYVPTSLQEFHDYLSGLGTIVGYVTPEDELAALGIYAHYQDTAHNYGADLGLSENQLDSVGQIDCTIVKKAFRGHKLQQFLCNALEEPAKSQGMNLICATVHPDNIYSLNTFLKVGYDIKCEKLKYGGLRRYVLAKHLA